MRIVLPTDFNGLRSFTHALRETLAAIAKQQSEAPLTGIRWMQQRTYHLFSSKTPGEDRVTAFTSNVALTPEGINLRDLIHACQTVLTSTSTEFASLITKVLKTHFHIEEDDFIHDFVRRKSFPVGLSDESDINTRYALFNQPKYRDAFITAEKKAMAGFIKDSILPEIEAAFTKFGIPVLQAAQPVPPQQPPKDQHAGSADPAPTEERRASLSS